jgi:hypothetical protein
MKEACMNRFSVFAAVLGLGMMGCATDVEDPIVNPTAVPQRDPPSQTLSGELEEPQDFELDELRRNLPSDLGPRQPYPIPDLAE